MQLTATSGCLGFSGSGTVVPSTGAFSVTGQVGGCTDIVFSGTGDGVVFAATISSSCPGISGTVSGTKYSNGVLDPGEQCDDGNAINGDCCSALRATEPAGQECNDLNVCSTGDVCAGGTCVGSPVPPVQTCASDGNDCSEDVCDAASVCTHTGVVPLCAGTIDLTGAWYLSWSDPYLPDPLFSFGDPHLRAFVQTGAVLTRTFQGQTFEAGAINPTTGDFMASTTWGLGSCFETLAGIAGTAFSYCFVGDTNISGPVAVTGVKCGSAGQPCCPGSPDTDSDTVCDAIDNCDTIANAPQHNSDGDLLGDACDPCTNFVPTVPSKAKLTLTKLLAQTNDDDLSFSSFFTSVPGTLAIRNGLTRTPAP